MTAAFIRRLTLTNFRGYHAAQIELGLAGPVVLTGANGAGKTNLIEAISLLAPGRGLRRATTEELAFSEGDGAWARLPATTKQQLRDNATTLLGQVGENRKPYGRADAQAIKTPTLFIGGTETKGTLPLVLRTLAPEVAGAQVAMIEGAGHWMFEHAPQRYAEIVTGFLAG